MSRWQPLWLLLACGIALGANRAMRPRMLYELAAGERDMATGSLWLQENETRIEVKLVTIHVVARAIRRPFAAAIPVRELWIRSPEQDGQPDPDLELFVDFSAADGHEIDAAARDTAVLSERELPILAVAKGSDVRSRVRLPGAETPAFVSEGSVLINEAIATDAAASWRIEGTVRLVARDQGNERHLNGKVSARLVWD
jgi:hypothetical protein